MNNLLKKMWLGLAILIIFAAVSSSIFRSLTPWATQYKGEVEQHLTSLLGQPVTIQKMETGWYWFQPVLKLGQVTINKGENNSLRIQKALVGIDLFKSLIHWRVQPGVLYVDDVHLVFRQKEGHWLIEGIKTPATTQTNPEQMKQLLAWISQQERLILKNVSARFHFSDGRVIPVGGLNLSIVNHGGDYKLKGEAKLEQTNSTSFQLLGKLHFDPNHLYYTRGQIYFSANNVLPAQWQNLFPNTVERLEGGKGNIDLWVDLDKGAVSLAQAHVDFKRLAWRLANTKKSQLIQSFYANLGWKPNEKGWQFHADHIKLRAGNVIWPENQISVTFDKTQNSYQLFAKTIDIQPLRSLALNWPSAVKPYFSMNPHGILRDTQVSIKEQQINYLLTRFEQLDWTGTEKIPQVENISGALHWQPDEGRLELDSENTTITVKGYPKQQLTLLNGAFDWKELSDGLRISAERFVISQPELTLSGQGAADQVSKTSLGNIRLEAQFSGKNVQQWMPYLPKNKLKPKLYEWLQKDVKRIAQASGQLVINGSAKDFPFDNNNGVFSITSHLYGTDLLITPKWPLVKDIEGYLRVKNRTLEADVVNADFQGVPLKQLNLRIDDLGMDKETLLMHGIVNGDGQKMMNFVMASPLKEKLAKLQMLAVKGLLALNLRLEIPLYPENNDNLAKGDLTFRNNTIVVQHQIGSLNIEEVNGDLSFNEKGVRESTLTGTAFGYPLHIKVKSNQSKHPFTTIAVDGDCPIDSLKSRLNLPMLSLFKGMFSINALFKLTDDPNDLDNVTFNSSLQGLAINLPAPLGKKYDSKAPLKVSLDFNPQKAIRLRANYNNLLSSDVLFKEQNGAFDLQSGQVRLGSANAINQKEAGLQIVGTLDGFDLQEWKKTLQQFSSGTTDSPLLKKLSIIDVRMSHMTFLKQPFDDMAIKAKILPNNDWSFNIEQSKVAADLTYHPATNLLSGFVKYLHLAKAPQDKNGEDPSAGISPGQIPNLNLRVDDLSIGDIQVGNVTFKSQSSKERFAIDYCRVESPVYQFDINGEWTQKENVNKTKMDVKLHLHDLAKSLELWQITPAVDAGKGDMEFSGGWNGRISDFSLASLNGSMALKLKNGRITHLSPETEEKLGLGKLLSILSLQTIPRRLTLDFSDLSHQGYSFDVFKGTFEIKKGIMSTQDSYIDGPVAYASMKGDLDLVRRLYDLNLRISPHITASLPVVATIAGGPVVGVAAWVANKIINQSMQKITGYSYKISGPWNQPVVQQLSIEKKLINKK